jgi:endoglucanase
MNNIPESGNGKSDLLDEAEKEVRFLLSMQVPQGESLEGMAHHKVHSDEWDAIPVTPAAANPHLLHRPSTAATLNLAATAAQCARIFSTSNPGLADDCLQTAETAYAAAQQTPNRLASPKDTDGGGAYDDSDVTDEFYWAAAELFVTTGKTAYGVDLFGSEHHAAPPTGTPFAWPTTATLGMLSLATVPNDLGASEIEAVRAALVLRAQADLPMAQSGYGAATDGYYWGSNSAVLNSGLLQAVAYDLTGEAAHRAAALSALDYVLGRNPLNQSYVSGYGVKPFENAHHRFWANAFDSSWPKPPAGVLAGGPNESLDGMSSSVISSLGLTGCAPSMCWSDYADGYSLTEVAINWNAPLAWLASWASEQEISPKKNFPGVDLSARPGSGPVLGSGGSGSGGSTSGGGSSSGSGATGNGSMGNGGSGDGGNSPGNGSSGGDVSGSGDRGGSDGNGSGGSDQGMAGEGPNKGSQSETPGDSGGCAYGARKTPRSWIPYVGLLLLVRRRRPLLRRPSAG